MFDDLTPMLWAHFIAAVAAMVLGARQLAAGKGTPTYRWVGYGYVGTMLLVNVGALATYRTAAGVNIFHALAMVSPVTLGAGLGALSRWPRDGEPRHLRGHQISMAYSYLGLVMAGVSQVALNPRFVSQGIAPDAAAYWLVFGAINAVLYTAGSWWIFHTAGRRVSRTDSCPPGR